MKIKRIHWFYIIVILIINISVYGCYIMKKGDTSNKLTLKDIAFDVNKKSGYTVYIKEDSRFEPYLVLTSNYNGEALLLRKEVLNEYYIFNDYKGYYKDSFIDKFLNNNFITTLTEIENAIIDTQITITAESSLGRTGTDTENITRKVFLLSCTEVGISSSASITCTEGKPLKYFESSDSRIAYKNDKACSWWLRTSDTWYQSSAFGIGPKGSLGGGNTYNKNGIRPAFCLSNTQLIEKSNTVIEGQTVYVITK